MAVLLALYLVVTVQYSILLLGTDSVIAKVEGAALLVLPLVGAWALVAELRFGTRAQRLLRRMIELDRLPVDTLPHRPSGRPDRAAADAEFPVFQAEVEANPDDWTSWYRLALAYDACGDRRRARWATRRAIRIEREAAARG
ncbi:hypothetical protein G3T37_03210 [Galbitalea soli]|uniref:Tetratricopeptide repeat protein n=2 Tax=Galbitalea soli TaxID=1268042 RepID=A0A7C9TPL6_9MICO|nr:hypothetical protein [Galbitalea soli]NEM90359.1 hypothetical protein [Galbitalea soli]